jgi:hypothetical protein
MFIASYTTELSLALFVGMWLFYELGRWEGRRELKRDPERFKGASGVVEAAVFGLLGLLLAFSFSGAAGRLDTRRQQITQEANAVGTSWLRLDLLPESHQPGLRQLFRDYLDTRIEVFQKLPDLEAALGALDRANKLQGDIWTQAIAACRASPSPPATMLLLPALNEMIDITTTRTEMAKTHLPAVIFALLCAMALLGSLLVGYGTADRPRRLVYTFAFIAGITVTIFVILDLEYPRAGWIRLHHADQVLVELRRSMQ